MKKSKSLEELGGLVYSTNPNLDLSQKEENPKGDVKPKDMQIRIWLQKIKGNKITTVVRGFKGGDESFKNMTTKLKQLCGCGGSYKNDEILIQGDQRNKVLDYFSKEGYGVKIAGG
ncbi:MAG: translation initiation factor [Luteibaculaceae bacterium]